MVRVVAAMDVEGLDVDHHDGVIVCDLDPVRATTAARLVPGRTAVYVGTAEEPGAAELAKELEMGLRP